MKGCGSLDRDIMKTLDDCFGQIESINEAVHQIKATGNKIDGEECERLLTDAAGILLNISDMCTMARIEMMALLQESGGGTLTEKLSRSLAEDLR